MRIHACIARAAALLAAPMALAGCGDDTGLPTRYAVRGTVKYKGLPVERGTISFVPVDPAGRAASGAIEGGSYTLTTLSPGDGALPGKYKVAVLATDVDLTAAREKASKGGSLRQDDVMKANRKAKALVPMKYSDANVSGLSADVEAKSNRKDMDLAD